MLWYAWNAQLIPENGWSEVGRWFRVSCFLAYRRWFLDQLTKIILTHRYDQLCRATGSQIVCFDRTGVFTPNVMTGGRWSGDRRMVFLKKAVFLCTIQNNLIERHLWAGAAIQPISLPCCAPYVGNVQRDGLRPRFSRNTMVIYFVLPISKNSVILCHLHCWTSKNTSCTDQFFGLDLARDSAKVNAYHFWAR